MTLAVVASQLNQARDTGTENVKSKPGERALLQLAIRTFQAGHNQAAHSRQGGSFVGAPDVRGARSPLGCLRRFGVVPDLV